MIRARAMLHMLAIQARSVRVRLTVWYLAILFATLVIFAVLIYLGIAHDLRSDMDSTLEQVALKVVDVGSGGRPRLDRDAVPPGFAASLHDRAGHVLAFAGAEEPLPWDGAAEAIGGAGVWRSVMRGEDTWRVFALPDRLDSGTIAIVQVGMPEASVDSAVDRLGILLAALVPVALLMAGAGGLFLAGRALEPIDRITRTAASIGGDDLARRLPERVVRTPGELGRLAATFNHMLDRLEEAFQRQRQFTADASHELRAPLTLLLGQVDVALQQPRSDREYNQALRGLREDILRLRQLVDALLALARADARQNMLAPEPLDFGELTQEIADALAPVAEERGIHLEARYMPGIIVRGDQARLMQLLLNLVENALNHTPTGGTVIVAAERAGNPRMATASVRDTGCGIGARHLPHVFERFYRVDTARTAGGAGLGLAICTWIAEAHGGHIEVQSEVGVGSTFTVWLPALVPSVVSTVRPVKVSGRFV